MLRTTWGDFILIFPKVNLSWAGLLWLNWRWIIPLGHKLWWHTVCTILFSCRKF